MGELRQQPLSDMLMHLEVLSVEGRIKQHKAKAGQNKRGR
jgi:hypothetical protein